MASKYAAIVGFERQKNEYVYLRQMRERLYREADDAFSYLSAASLDEIACQTRDGLYDGAYKMFNDLVGRLCPDINLRSIRKLEKAKGLRPDAYSTPIYELEKFPSVTISCLKAIENSKEFGMPATVDNLSRLTPGQVSSLIKDVKRVGRKSMARVAEALKKYGVGLDVTAATGLSAYLPNKARKRER